MSGKWDEKTLDVMAKQETEKLLTENQFLAAVCRGDPISGAGGGKSGDRLITVERLTIENFLADPATKERVSIAVQATLKAITDQNNSRKTVRVGQAAEIITSVVLDALSPTAADINLAATEVAGNG